MNTISVVIPTCDRENLLQESVQCVLEQSRPANEIIVVNNGKTSLKKGLLPDAIVIHELPPYTGVARARNHGAMNAKSEYIAFQDDDDLWEKDYLEKVSALIDQKHPDCIITRLDKLENQEIKPHKNANGKINFPNLFTFNPGIGGQTTIVRRNAFMEIGGYDENLPPSEDKSLVIDFLISGYSVVTAPHIQSIMRFHDAPRLTDPIHMQIGISKFVMKYEKQMSFPQKNFNWLKVHYYRYLTSNSMADYCYYSLRLLLHSIFCKINPALPNAPKLKRL